MSAKFSYGAECWAKTVKDIDRLRRTDRAMIRWICKVRLEDRVSSDTLLKRMKLTPVESAVQDSRLRWYGHVCRSSDWINKITELHVEGSMPRGRPRKTWLETVYKDKKLRGMENVDPTDRDAWRLAQANRRKRESIKPAG